MKKRATSYGSSNQTKLSNFFSVSPLRSISNDCKTSTNGNNVPSKRKSGSPNPIATGQSVSPKKSKGVENKPSPEKRSPIKATTKLASLESKTNGLVRRFGQSWLPALEKEFQKSYFEQLSRFVEQERSRSTIYPRPDDVFTWTTACRLKDVKVVILGQDPYHGPNQAHGLCFSVLPNVKIPPSLQNMYRELSTDIQGFQVPGHGYLKGWATQGVLLLNAVLTVREATPNSHKSKGWENLTDAVIQYLNTNMSHLVFILWGSYAQKKGAHISQKKHCVLKGVHPSPLSAHRGFFGCKHFSKANAYLESHGKPTVDWNFLSDQH